jgi:hypothetical protein
VQLSETPRINQEANHGSNPAPKSNLCESKLKQAQVQERDGLLLEQLYRSNAEFPRPMPNSEEFQKLTEKTVVSKLHHIVRRCRS